MLRLIITAGVWLTASATTISTINDYYNNHAWTRRVQKINPALSPDYSAQMVEAIFKASQKYNLKPEKLFAILAHESKFDIRAINYRSHDYGVGQINIRNVKHYGLSTELLTSNIEYSVEAAAFILSNFKKGYAHLETDWWTRYNSSNPKNREAYMQLVSKFLRI